MTEIFDDIKSLYRFSAPCGEMADYIEFFSESSAEKTSDLARGEPFTVRMFPSWTPTIWLNLSTPYSLTMGDQHYAIRRDEDILVLRDSLATRHNLPTDHIFTIKFFPGGLEAVAGISQARFMGRVVDATAVIPAPLIRSVKDQAGFEGRVHLLEDYFLRTMQKKRPADHYTSLVRDSIALYHAVGMRMNTTELAEKMFITSKTINRYFNNVVGTSPKKYFSILRARAALAAYISAKSTFQPCDHGYYDMSHFYRESAAFTGRRMTQLQ